MAQWCETLNNREDWYWYPLQQYVAVEGQTKIIEGGTYHTLFNGPVFYTQSFTVNLGVDEGARSEPWRPPPERYAQVVVTYRLARVEITPNPPDFQVQTATMTRTGMVLQPTVGFAYTHTYITTTCSWTWDWYNGWQYNMPRYTGHHHGHSNRERPHNNGIQQRGHDDDVAVQRRT